ncbi:MAG: hypothetical protein DMD26_12715 [Gemmatimonadetes bacterium]|nr:MAG: hypothetical protein DMD26_12715 [Gemmatimonadota bacterium]
MIGGEPLMNVTPSGLRATRNGMVSSDSVSPPRTMRYRRSGAIELAAGDTGPAASVARGGAVARVRRSG